MDSDDQSLLEPIEFTDRLFLKEVVAEEDEKVEDQFPDCSVLAVKECLLFPKNSQYCVIRFGENFKDRALATWHVVHTEQGNSSLANIRWSTRAYFNGKRINRSFNGVHWLATLVWTECRKPCGSCHLNDQHWTALFTNYLELGFDLDVSLRKPQKLTIRSIADGLNACIKASKSNKPVAGQGACDLENIASQ
ncbi:hypothetical protein HDE_02469 [Halotydeus destructor]|nr:hypothetical protein HDE_02469 [Halotydeus destructor]